MCDFLVNLNDFFIIVCTIFHKQFSRDTLQLNTAEYRITKRTATQSPPRHRRRRRHPRAPALQGGAHPSALETLAERATMAATAAAPGTASSLLLSPRRSRGGGGAALSSFRAAAPRFRSPVSLPSRSWSGRDRV